MARVKLQPNTAEWLEWRRGKRMASETPAVCGVCPYNSPESVRNAKRGRASGYQTDAMKRGHEQEEIARPVIADALGEPFEPGVFESGEYGASVDGINLGESVIIEIKSPWQGASSTRWHDAGNGHIAENDWYQVQHQLMVTGAERAVFAVWSGDDWLSVDVYPDADAFGGIVAAWDRFWPTIERRDDLPWHEAARRYREAKAASDRAAKELADAKAELIELTPGGYSSGAGVKVERINRKGNVDWAKVQKTELPGVDVEQYRKPGSSFYQVAEVKDDVPE